MKMNYLKISAIVALMCVFLNVKAALPELKIVGPTAMPFTITNTSGQKYIDVDGNGSIDYTISFYQNCDNLSGSWMPTDKFELASFGSGSGLILSEIEVSESGIPQAQGVAPQDFATEYHFTSLLEKGVAIQSTPVVGSNWYGGSATVSRKLFPTAPGAAPTSSHFDGVQEGYVGVSFNNGGMHYGWIHVRINGGGQSVDVLSSGFQSSVGAPVMAGANDPYATTPIPLIASILGFGLIGGGAFFRKKFKK